MNVGFFRCFFARFFFMESVVEGLGLKRAGSSVASVLSAGWLSLCAASCFNVFV